MAEALVCLTDTESSSSEGDYERSSSDNSDVNKYRLAFDEIREERVQEEGQDRKRLLKDTTDALCNVCFMHNLIALTKNVAFYLCYVCEKYLCDECFKGHESHKYINLVSEKSEKEMRRREFLERMRNQSERGEKFERESVSMVDRVNVKHGLDQDKDCYITGLCGLDNTRWVVCDYNHYCIKLFNVGSNLLQRYIRLWSEPWDVTEIKVESEPTEQGVLSTIDMSVMNPGKQDKQSLLAVTLPWGHRILIIDVTPNPAVITKTIKTEGQCRSIDFGGDHIVTLCCDGYSDRIGHGYTLSNRPWFVFVMSTDGVTIKTINTDVNGTSRGPYFAVCPGRFYITFPYDNKVLCLNNEGNVVSHKTIEGLLVGSEVAGIVVDPDTNHVYVCDRGQHKLYRLDSSLESLEPLFDFKSVNLKWPDTLCLYRDKLYVSHESQSLLSTHDNFVTVVRVL